MPDFLQVIQDKRDSFTRSYRLLADYIEEHTVEIAFMSIQELSSQVHVSTATIHRFCLEIGLSGYPDFQREIQNEIRERYNAESSQLDPAEAAQNTLSSQVQRNIRILQEIQANGADLQAAIDRSAQMLIRARRIYVLGMEGDYSTAYATYYDFMLMFDNVILLSMESGNFSSAIRTITPDDVLYIISFRVYNRHILEIINRFLEVNANIITLADEGSPFNTFANVSMIPRHNTPSYGSVMKVTIQRALLLTIIQKQREEKPKQEVSYLHSAILGLDSLEEGH